MLKLLLMCALIPPLYAQNTGGTIDLNRYSGKWYIIACIPTKFDKTWEHVTETYTIADASTSSATKKIDIYTTYTTGDDTTVKDVRSKGFVKSSDNSFWRVQFVWPFRADYLIEEIGSDYSYAVVGHRQKKYLYIMSRTPKFDQELYKTLIDKYSFKNYNMSLLRKIEH